MNIDNILKLNIEHESLNIISEFLNKSLSQNDYEQSLLKYLEISYELKLYDILLKNGNDFLERVKQSRETKYREEIYKYFFLASLNLEKYNKAYKYLNKRKELLKELEKYKSLLDELKIIKAQNKDPLKILLNLKNEVIPNDILIFVNEELYNYYLNKDKLDDALNLLVELFDLTLNYKYENEMIKIYYLKQNYEKVVKDATNLINENANNLYTVVFLISSLTILKNYRRASSIEAEYEHAIDKSNDNNFKLFAYNEIIKLYELTNNQISIDLYKDKLKNLKRETKKSKTDKKEKVVEKIKVKEVKTKTLVSDAKYLKHFSWIKEWLNYSHNLKLNMRFREYLRTLFIEIENKFKFESVIIYYNDKELESNFFHYKKERLFDKTVTNFYIEDTIIKDTIDNKIQIFGPPETLKSKKDVLTQKPFNKDIKYVYSIYINDDFVITFYLDEEIKDAGLYFELFSGISTIIKLRIKDELENKRLNKDSKYLDKLINNPVIPMRTLTFSRSKYNDKAIELFKIDKNLHIELFLREVELEDSKIYEKHIERLFNYPNETKIFKYQYQDLVILEYMFAIKDEKQITIYSYFIDLTNKYKLEKDLSNKANYDLETSLKNKYNFENSLNKYLKDKHTFVLIELDLTNRDIFGLEKTNKFFIEFSQITNKHFKDYDLYRYNFNQLLLVINQNDIRTINNIMDDYFSVINNLESYTIKGEKFNVKVGFLRYPVASRESKVENIYKYLDVALNNTKINKTNYTDFTYNMYEKDVFEQQVIDYLNEAILNKKVNLRFNQIINLDKNTVFNYESELYLPNINIDSDYLLRIAKRRKKLVELEYFHIEMVASFLHKMVKETGYYVNVLIKISKETYNDRDFENYFSSIFKKYNVSLKHVSILINNKIKTQKDLARAERLIKYGIKIQTKDLESALKLNVDAIHLSFYDTNKYLKYIKNTNELFKEFETLLIVRDVINTNTRNKLLKNGIKYIMGDFYKKLEASDLIEQIKDNQNENNK